MSGFFVVIDGPSGIGKTTIVQLLGRRLADSEHRVVATREAVPRTDRRPGAQRHSAVPRRSPGLSGHR